MFTQQDVDDIIKYMSSHNDNMIKLINSVYGSYLCFFLMNIWPASSKPRAGRESLDKAIINYFKKAGLTKYVDKMPEHIKNKILAGIL